MCIAHYEEQEDVNTCPHGPCGVLSKCALIGLRQLSLDLSALVFLSGATGGGFCTSVKTAKQNAFDVTKTSAEGKHGIVGKSNGYGATAKHKNNRHNDEHLHTEDNED